jgi:hypothetical protein
MGEDGRSKNVTVSSCPVLNLQILHENARVTTSNSNPFESGPRASLSMALINFNVILHLRVGFPSGVLPSDYPTKILHSPIFAPIHATCPSHLILLYLITHIVFGEEYRALSSLLCSLFPLPSYLVTLRPKYPPQHHVLCASVNVNSELSHPYKTTGKIIQGGSNMTGTNCDLFTHK